MALMREIRRRAKHVVGPMLMVSVAAYFGYHAVQGDRGLIAWWQVTQDLKNAKATYARVHGEREALEHRVALLGPDKLDLDLLEERAHAMLDLAEPDEVVIFDNPAAAPPPPNSPAAQAPVPQTRAGGR